MTCLAFSPDGTRLAGGSVGRTISVWDVETGQLRHEITADRDSISCLAFARDGQTLAVSHDYDERVWLFDAATGDLTSLLTGHSNSVNSIASSMDGRLLVSAGCDGTLNLWDVATASLLRTFVPMKPEARA